MCVLQNLLDESKREVNINGLSVAYTDYDDVRIQRLLAHQPILLHKHPKDVLAEGQAVNVAVLDLDRKKRRISLSIKQSGGSTDPRAEAMQGVQKGARLEVVVEKVESFGVFCTIAEGITGLIPNSHMNTPRGTNHSRKFKPGTKVEVLVIDLDRRKGKITLSRKALADDGARADFVAYRKQVEAEEKTAGKTAFQLAWEAAQGK